MAKNTAIEWTDHSWNPVTGCTQISPGCDHCYAKTIAEFRRGTAFPNGFDITLRPHKIREPRKWKQPSFVFVNSMSDLFHREIPDDYLGQIWETMLVIDRHIYQILTKRPHRAAQKIKEMGLPLPDHIRLGTSVESQKFADNRIPALLSIEASVLWLSCEPLLGPLDLTALPGRPSMDRRRRGVGRGKATRRLRMVPVHTGRLPGFDVPYFHKQGNAHWSGKDREIDGRTWDQYPKQLLRV